MTIRLKKDDKPIPFRKLFDDYNCNGCLDIQVFVGENRFSTRLVAYQVIPSVANERRRKLNKISKHQGRTTTTECSSRQEFRYI